MNKEIIANELAIQMKKNMKPTIPTNEEKIAEVLNHLNLAAEYFDEAGNSKFAELVTNLICKMATNDDDMEWYYKWEDENTSIPDDTNNRDKNLEWLRQRNEKEAKEKELSLVPKKLDECAVRGHQFTVEDHGFLKCKVCGHMYYSST